MSLFNKLHGGQAGEQLINNLKSVCPDFVNMTIEWATEGIMARPGLDLLTREYLLIASCTTLGYAVPQLKAHIDAALKLGGTRQQIVEVILQMLFYAGGAATSNALSVGKEVFEGSQTVRNVARRTFNRPLRLDSLAQKFFMNLVTILLLTFILL